MCKSPWHASGPPGGNEECSNVEVPREARAAHSLRLCHGRQDERGGQPGRASLRDTNWRMSPLSPRGPAQPPAQGRPCPPGCTPPRTAPRADVVRQSWATNTAGRLQGMDFL